MWKQVKPFFRNIEPFAATSSGFVPIYVWASIDFKKEQEICFKANYNNTDVKFIIFNIRIGVKLNDVLTATCQEYIKTYKGNF